MKKFFSLCCGLIFIISLTACSKNKTEEQASTPAKPAQQTAQQAAQEAAPAPAPQPVTGKVLETMDSSGYTYLKVATDAGEKWVAVNQTPVKVGEEVTYIDGMVMQNFFSKSLNRTFPEVIFSSGLVGKDAVAQSMPPAGKAEDSFSKALSSEGTAPPQALGDMMGSQKAIVPFAEIKVDKAPGDNSYTVAEIFNKAAELNGKTVVVRGKVMKVSPRIMGRNWIHIQDGTGNPAENTHDLVITTSQDAQADWDIITMEGVLAANKDFGSGYKYAAIIEDAKLKN